MSELYNIFQYIHFTPLFVNKTKMYFTIIIILILLNYIVSILLFVMAVRIKNNKLNILWPISILKVGLPFISFSFFSQTFLLLATIFDCKNGYAYVSTTLKCRTGTWFTFLGPTTGLALFLEACIAILTNSLYFKPVFIHTGSNLLKKTNSLPDIIFIITKIGVNILFISDKGTEDEHWAVLFILILFTGTNAYYNLYYQNRENKKLTLLNNIFSLITVLAYVSLLIGKIFIILELSGLIYLFFSSIVIIIVFIFIYKNDEIDYILIDYKEINNPVDYLYYITEYYKIIVNSNKSRTYLTILKCLITKIEENCIVYDCPLKKYLINLKNGIDCPFLLKEYIQVLFQYGIAKFTEDISLKNNYSIFLITNMNFKKKAITILNNIKSESLTFINRFYVYRTLRLIDKWKFSLVHKDNSIFGYRQNIQHFKNLIKQIIIFYYEFITLILESKIEYIDNFNKINRIGMKIMKCNPKIDEVFNKLINIKTDNLEIIKFYSEFAENILKNKEKFENCQKISKLAYSNIVKTHEKDFSNFDMEILNEKGNLPYLILSTDKDSLGKIIDLSLKTLKIFGYTKTELIDKHINILLPKIIQEKHDLNIIQQYEKHKLRIQDDLNKKNIYFPDFIKKETFGISKMKFLVELKLNIYFVQTEQNNLVYIIEIINYHPLTFDLIKNINQYSKCCILTDENFLIQTFTPNCLEYLKLNYSDMNSNFSIINYIKQFQEDYLTAINNTSISMLSHFNSSEMLSEDRLSFFNIPPVMKKKIKNDLLIKKYSKKCKITWKVSNANITKKKTDNKNYYHKKSQNSIKCSKSKIFRANKSENSDDVEIDVLMEIKKIILQNELLGYCFFFTKVKSKSYSNMSYTIQKNETFEIKNDLTKIKLKKYQCRFKPKGSTNIDEEKFSSGKNQLFGSFVIKYPEKNFFKKNGHRKSLDKNPSISTKEKKLLNDYSLMLKNNESNKLYDSDNEDSSMIDGNFIPEYTSNFSLNLKNLSFHKIKEKKKDLKYVELLKQEAEKKINTYQEQLKTLCNSSKSSQEESEERESNELSSSSLKMNSLLNKDSSNNSNSNSLNDNKKEQNLINNDKKEINKTNLSSVRNKIEKDSSNNNISIAIDNSSKTIQKKSKAIDNYYKVNLKDLILMKYDFKKDMIVEEKKIKSISKIESIINNIKNETPLDIEKDERFSFFSNKNKKTKKSSISKGDKVDYSKSDIQTNNTNININNSNNIVNEKELIKKKIYEALNKHKEEPPIKKLKIISLFCFLFMIVIGSITVYLDLEFIGKIKRNLNLVKNTILIKYCSFISVYYLRELTLLNFNIKEIDDVEYINIPSKSKSDYLKFIKEELLKLFLENQSSIKVIYSSFSISKNSTNYISDYKLDLKLSNTRKIILNSNILNALMIYNSAFYNLVSTTSPLVQNHTDLITFIYNNLNGYSEGLEVLVNTFHYELELNNNELKIIIIILGIFNCICLIIFNYLFIKYFFSAIHVRINYMKIFYGINDNVLKRIIANCENLLNKLKCFDEQIHIEEQSLSPNHIEGNFTIGKSQKMNEKEKTYNDNNNLSNDNDNNKIHDKMNLSSYIFIIFYGVYILIFYFFCICKGIYMFNISNLSIIKSLFYIKKQYIQLGVINFYNVYREFLFDENSMISDMTPLDYLIDIEKQGHSLLTGNIKFIEANINKVYAKNTNRSEIRNLCSYYKNDFFDSTVECSDKIGLISNYDFNTLLINFIDEININKNVMRYKLKHQNILGNLTNYNISDYIIILNTMGDNDIFRLDLFNNETLHGKLNIIFFSIILPYIQEDKQEISKILIIDNIEYFLLSLSCLIGLILALAFFCYFIPIINYVNSIIYKTKNMLSIIPLSILSYQNDVLILLGISNNN